MGVEKRFGEMRYLLGSSPRKRDHYQKRSLMAVEGKNEGGRLNPGALAKWISAGGTWNSGTLGHLGERRWHIQRGSPSANYGASQPTLDSLWLRATSCVLFLPYEERRMRWYRASFLSDRKGIVRGENMGVQGCYPPSCSWYLLKRVKRS